jgi:predicted transcriptional regulator
MNESKDSLNEREFELINIIGAELGANQRDISKKMDISLGMTNLLVRRLVAKGYIRLRQLNKKKTEYILTPKGFSEKYHKSLRYTLKTLRSIGLIRTQLNIVIQRLYDKGERVFLILGHSDLAELLEMSLRQPQWTGVEFSRVENIFEQPRGIFIFCREKMDMTPPANVRYVHLLQELANQKTHGAEIIESETVER